MLEIYDSTYVLHWRTLNRSPLTWSQQRIYKNLEKDLQSLQTKYSEGVPQDQGRFIWPKATCGAEKVLQLKWKYKRLTQSAIL